MIAETFLQPHSATREPPPDLVAWLRRISGREIMAWGAAEAGFGECGYILSLSFERRRMAMLAAPREQRRFGVALNRGPQRRRFLLPSRFQDFVD